MHSTKGPENKTTRQPQEFYIM
uniref:Uncharacterized protein n=1 Tax=Rhizophora mucronata TaxID=61149 RepID=A0A2P2JAM0_RHIMU